MGSTTETTTSAVTSTIKRVAIIGGAACLFTIASLSLIAYHTKPHCSVKTGDTTVHDCTDLYCDSAYAVYIKVELSRLQVITKYSCPWNGETVALGLLGSILALVCLGVLFFTVRGKDLKAVMLTLTAVIVPVLLTAFGLMIRDLKRAYDQKDEDGLTEGFRPGSYIANIIILFFGLCLLTAAAFFGHRQTAKN